MGGHFRFPKELLLEPSIKRYKYFEKYVVAHPKLIQKKEELLSSLNHSSGDRIILLVGPSGVGKSTLKENLKKQYIKNTKRGIIPVVDVEAIPPDQGQFNWKDYYRRSLEKLNEPLIDHKKLQNPAKIDNLTYAALRKSLENALYYRKTSVFLIDEAQHFMKMKSGRKFQEQFDIIKSIANITKVPHVLFGTYELLSFININAQLSRRSTEIHFSRYKLDSIEDIKDFQKTILSFQRQLPVRKEPSLVENWEFLYERSLGCVGILKNWLERALIYSMEHENDTITKIDIKETAISLAKASTIAEDMVKGELELEEDIGKQSQLKRLLGFEEFEEIKDISEKKKIKVGQRKPKRDVVGGGFIEEK